MRGDRLDRQRLALRDPPRDLHLDAFMRHSFKVMHDELYTVKIRIPGGDNMRYTRIMVNHAQMGGVPCIRGLRIPVAAVVGMVADGMSESEILDAYTDLEADDIREALHFAAESVRESELPLVANA